MDSNSLRNSKIISDYNIKESKNSKTILNNISKNKIKKIKCLYFDSNELTKDETSNKLEKYSDCKKNKEIDKNKNKLFLKDKNNIKLLKYKKCVSNEKDKIKDIFENLPDISKGRNSKLYKINNFKYFNKKDINYLLNNKAKTLNDIDEKRNKVKLSINNEEESRQREHSKEQSIYNSINPNSFNEKDLFNKIKKVNFEKYMINCFKTIKNADENILIDEQLFPKNINIKKSVNPNEIFLDENHSNSKSILNSERSKMKAYTNISKLIKYNIIEKQHKNKIKKIEIKQNYIINKNNKFIFDKFVNKDENENSKKNNANLNFNVKENNKEKNDCEDVPQRRPGCCTEKKLNVMNKGIKLQNEKIKRNDRIKKNNKAFATLQPKSTFTKSLKATKILNHDTNESKYKGNNIFNNNLLKTIIKKFQTQRFNKNINSKKKYIKNNKNKLSKNNLIKSKSKNKTNIKYLNLKDNFYKNSNSNINKYYKYLNFTLFDSKNAIEPGRMQISLKNNSFSSGFKKTANSNKIKKNSFIKKIH